MKLLTNCKNCGAALKYQNKKDEIIKCEYCRTEYYFDNYGEFKGQCITINYEGKLRRYYIAKEEYHILYRDAYRDINGNLVTNKIKNKHKLTLIEF